MLDIPVRVKDALRDGRLLKNYKINVLNDNMSTDFTIDNDNLVSESVKIDERMCSGDTLKFGLCEGASLEFQYFDKDDILGRQIQVFLDVQYEDANGDLQWYSDLPMGYFTVAKCPQQYSTGIYKVTAYNKLMSEYLDAKANDQIVDIIDSITWGASDQLNVGAILESLLSDYTIEKEPTYVTYTVGNPAHGATSTSTLRDTTDPSVGYLHPLEITFYLNIDNMDASGFYRLVADCREIFDESFSTTSSVTDTDIFYDSSTGTSDELYYWLTLYSRSKAGGNIQVIDASSNINGDNFGEYRGYSNHKYPWMTNIKSSNGILVTFKSFYFFSSNTHTWTQEEYEESLARAQNALFTLNNVKIELAADSSSIDGKIITKADAQAFSDVTLRDLQSSVYELSCQYGQLSRTTDLFEGVELNQSALYPAEDLYPADNLYPNGTRERTVKSGYSKLWSESGNVQKWRYLTITWAGLDENNIRTTYETTYTVNANGTQDYIMDNNWMLNNLTWTQAQIDTYAAVMIAKMRPITWFPFELWGPGLPYLEVGDQIEIVDRDDNSYPSYVLERQLNGIQNLQDTYINGVLDIF